MDRVDGARKRIEGGCSVGRIINLIIAVAFLLLLITSIVTCAILGDLTSRLKDDGQANSTRCSLFMTYSGGKLQYKGGAVCGYVEASFGLIGLFSLVYIIVQVIRALLKTSLWFTVVVDLVALVVCLLACFAAAITLSVGQLTTCIAVDSSYGQGGCNHLIPDNTSGGILYYDIVNAAQGAAWFCFLFICGILVTTIARVIIFLRRRRAGVPMSMKENILTAEDKPDSQPI